MSQDLPVLSLDHLEIVHTIGEGSMAAVYKAHDKRLKVDRAVKVLAAHLVNSEQIRTRFMVEAQTMANLNHPNVVSVLDVDLDGQHPYIVMEFISGGSLRHRLDRGGPLAPRIACDAMVDLLQALEAAHNAGVLHRDIKPENLLITDRGTVKVSDFGIAHVEDAGHSLTKTGAVLGTAGFMSPEQQRSAKGLEASSDLYSVGATMYTALTGENPDGLHVQQARERALESIDPALHAFFAKACAMDPAQRYPSAAEMRTALLAAKEALPPDPTDALPLNWGVPKDDSSEDAVTDGAHQTEWAKGTLFGRFERTGENARFQTEWSEDRGRRPLLIAISVITAAAVLAAIGYSLIGS